MKTVALYFLKHFLFFLLMFLFFRLAFYLVHINAFRDADSRDLMKAMLWHNLKLDLSVVCYLMFLPVLFLTLGFVAGTKWSLILHRIFFAIVLFWMIVLALGNIIIYKEWGTLINARALMYATQPKEMLASASNVMLVISFSIWFIGAILLYRIYNRLFSKLLMEKITPAAIKLLVPLASLPLLFIGARGGLQQIPINESSAYFSAVPVVNLLSTNVYWYLGHNVIQSRFSNENPFRFTNEPDAEKKVFNWLHLSEGESPCIFDWKDSTPNIVLIILESWSADLVEKLGGENNITPEFEKLSRDGLAFSNIYSSGFRTDQGVVSLLSGFPAQPNQSIIRSTEKTAKLPFLSRSFAKRGYHTSFYYGGEIAFASLNTYLLNGGFDKILDKNSFHDSTYSSKWGAQDEFVLQKHLEDLSSMKQPFFSTVLTLSSHEPFDIPVKSPFGTHTTPDLFRGAAWYTDRCLGNYFEKMRTQPFFQNTIFILAADHGHRLPKEHDYENPGARRMTLMIYSPLLKQQFRNQVIESIGGQHDLAATVLSQLGMDHKEYEWSNNLLNDSRKNFAYISLDYAIGWLTPSGYFKIRLDDRPDKSETALPEEMQVARSYMQVLYQRYLDY